MNQTNFNPTVDIIIGHEPKYFLHHDTNLFLQNTGNAFETKKFDRN